MLKIGDVLIDGDLVLAPMAGVNNIAFMLLCKEQGADLIYTAMLDPKRVLEENDYTKFPEELSPLAIQLVGGNPKIMGKAAKFITENKRADIIDINLGCAEGEVLGAKGGCYLMQNENMLIKLVTSVIENTSLPVTAKIRSGWDENNKNAVKTAKILEDLGIKAIAIHPRTRKQRYMGKADWMIIKQVKEAVKIPVIGSGDVIDPESKKKMQDFTGCDAVMIGRAAKGDPEIFRRIRENKNVDKKIIIQKELFNKFLEYYKRYDDRNFSEIQTHALWFFKGLKNSKSIINEIMKVKDREELIALIKTL